MNNLNRELKKEGKRICIVDVDGTLIDASRRFRVATKRGRVDWKVALDIRNIEILDKPMPKHIIDKIKNICRDICNEIIILTGRPENLKDITIRQIKNIDFKYDKLIMRNVGDYSNEVDFKIRKILEISKFGNICAIFDDNLEFLKHVKNLLHNVKIFYVTYDDVYELVELF